MFYCILKSRHGLRLSCLDLGQCQMCRDEERRINYKSGIGPAHFAVPSTIKNIEWIAPDHDWNVHTGYVCLWGVDNRLVKFWRVP